MKRRGLFIALTVVVAILAVSGVQALAEDFWILGCYHRIQKNLGIFIGHEDECIPPEETIFSYATGPPETAKAQIIEVYCTNREPITPAVKRARPGDTILINGTCYESVTLVLPNHDRFILVEQGKPIIYGEGRLVGD